MTIFIPEDKVLEIKNAADIVDVVSESVLLKKTGKNYVGLCPFHSEKTPSFTVSPQKQIFYCFGCAAGGNVFSFIMKRDGISFPEAARILSKQYGIHVPVQKMSKEQKRLSSERENLLGVNRQAMDFFHNNLFSAPSGKQAVLYLKKRGISQETMEIFRLGYAPEGWNNINNFFQKKKIPLNIVEKAGLIVKRKNKDGFYDRFRNRIIFPIFNANMHVIAFGGRVLNDDLPKYLNSPETPIYNKSSSLYGLHRARQECRETERVYIVEGYFDLLALHQNGIQNSVATLGTSITADHVGILRNLIGKDGRVVLVFDSDDAGMKATLRSIGIFMNAKVDANIMLLPSGHDPDSYLNEFGYESFIDIAKSAKSLISFLLDALIEKYGLTVEGKIRVISEMRETLASIDDSMARSLYIKEIAERVGIEETAVLEKVRELSFRYKSSTKRDTFSNNDIVCNHKKNGFQKADKRKSFHGKLARLEKQIISMMLQFPPVLSEIGERGILDLFEENRLKAIGDLILAHQDCSDVNIVDIINLIEDNEERGIVASMAFEENKWEYDGCLNILNRFESIRNKKDNTLIKRIKEAEESDDLELLSKLLRKKQKMAVLSEKKKMALLK
ncbi:MAG: DNA primase [Deltaproteobacteria bacterium]|nr:DNA primase [Deltaproteobacteria bacterium]